MITCAEAVKQLWNYIDGVVDDSERARIEEHLGFCRRCCGELEFAEELQRFLVAHADDDGLPDDVRARLTATLDDLERR
jgi:mycothiol system anti-sigma-R factor